MIKDYNVRIKAGGTHKPVIGGNYIHLLQSSAPLEPLRVRAYSKDSQQTTDINMRKGDNVRTSDFISILIENPSGSDIDAVFVVGKDEKFDAGEGEVNAKFLANVSLVGLPSVNFTVAGQNKTILGNLSRKVLDLFADASNTGVIYIGSSDGLTGIPLAKSGTYSIDVTGDVELWGTQAGDKLHMVEVL